MDGNAKVSSRPPNNSAPPRERPPNDSAPPTARPPNDSAPTTARPPANGRAAPSKKNMPIPVSELLGDPVVRPKQKTKGMSNQSSALELLGDTSVRLKQIGDRINGQASLCRRNTKPNDIEASQNDQNFNREVEQIQKEKSEYLNYPLNVEDCIKRLTAYKGALKINFVNLAEAELRSILANAEKIFLEQPMLLELDSPVKIVADIHGQFVDLMRIFDLADWPPKSNYLFLGDMVDRGPQQIETVALLLCFKIKYPGNVFIVRGNHEASSLHRRYGFQGECKSRYSLKLWRAFVECFNTLPVAALVDEKIFCCHGGLSPELMKGEGLDKIRELPRPTDVPDEGLICDLMWADPDPDVKMFQESDRGVSYLFGAAIVEKFLDKYDLDLIARGHQVETDGYAFFADRQLVTLFSAPNYCGEFDNAAAIMAVEEDLTCSFQVLPPQECNKKRRKSRAQKNKNFDSIYEPNCEAVCPDPNCRWCYSDAPKQKKNRKLCAIM